MTPARKILALALALVETLLLAAAGGAWAVAQQAPPPTPVPPRGSPSPFQSVLQTPEPGVSPPAIGAASATLVDLSTGQVLFGVRATRRRPVASLTKILTAILTLERTDPSDVVTVSEEAAPPPGSFGRSLLPLEAGERIQVGELSYALLLQSANDAAEALAEHISGSVDAFVAEMNARARELGLRDTRFFSPNGLDDRGYSTARDLVELTREAYRSSRFAQIVRTKFHDIPAPRGKPRGIQNRNVLLWLYPGAVGVKTGFTTAAGFCLVAVAKRDGMTLVAVVLGAEREAFSDAATLLNYGFEAFERRTLVMADEDLGTADLGAGSVDVATAGRLNLLVPSDVGDRIKRRLVLDPSAAFPPVEGERVGRLVLSAPQAVLGSVPVVVTDVPPPPPADGGPWWRRAGLSVARALAATLGSVFD